MPLQKRLFVGSRSPDSPSSRDKAASTTSASRKSNEGHGTVRNLPNIRNLPPESLRTHNATLCSERLLIVTAFLDEEDSTKDCSSEKDATEGLEVKEGSTVSPNRLPGGAPPNASPEDASTRPAMSARQSRRSVGGLDVTNGPTSSPTMAGGRKSALDFAGRVYGHEPRRQRQSNMPAWRAPVARLPLQEDGQAKASKEFSNRIMAALCKQAYQGIKQVERQVFLTDERLSGTLGSPSGHGASGLSGTLPSVGGARLRQDGLDGETPTGEDMVEPLSPTGRSDRYASQQSVSLAEGDTD